MTKIFIDGKEGTTGLKIFERLEKRPDLEIVPIPDELRKDPSARAERINSSDVTILCLPDAAAVEAVALAKGPVRIIDASTAHRTSPSWAYGFPELSDAHRKAVATGSRIAVPGCHASGFLSIVYPLRESGILPADYPLVCHSLTGFSGGGKKMIASYGNESFPAPRQYALGQTHKHLKEMTFVAKLDHPPVFNPIVSDYFCGMEVTVPLYARLLKGGKKDIYEVLKAKYEKSPLIDVFYAEEVYPDGFCPADGMKDSNRMKILVGGNEERVNIVSLFDNLGKGASGAAVQCLNIMLGLDETYGLI